MTIVAIVAALIALVAWGVGGIFDKLALNGLRGRSPLLPVMARMPFALLVVGAIGLHMGMYSDLQQMELRAWAYLVLSALIAAVIGQAAYFFAASAGQISNVVAFTSAWPLVTVFLAVVWLGDSLSWPKVLGTVLIIGGLALLAAPGKHASDAAASEPTTDTEITEAHHYAQTRRKA